MARSERRMRSLGRRKAPGAGPGSRGFSLVEILVVLVVLILGIFSIARLFPEGFANINFTANIREASALAQAQAETLKKHAENLPDGIVAVDPATGNTRTGITPADLSANLPYTENPLAGSPNPLPDDPRYSGTNQVRRIIGEACKIPPPTVGYGAQGERVSLYSVLFSPIYSARPLPPHSQGVTAWSGTPATRMVTPYDDQAFGGANSMPLDEFRKVLFKLGPTAYAINYNLGKAYFLSAPYDRIFRVEYTFHSGSTAGQSIPNNYLPVQGNNSVVQDPNNPDITVVDLHTGVTFAGYTFSPVPAAATVDAGSEILSRVFTQIAPGTAFSTLDPYEFKVYDTVFGLLGFNPLTANLALAQQSGRGLTARISYDVDDWHIVRQDVLVPTEVEDASAATPLHAVKLTSASIKKVGDTEDVINLIPNTSPVDATYQYQGLVRYYPGSTTFPTPRQGTSGIDLFVIDTDTGARIDSTSLQQGGNSTNGYIDYERGILHLADSVAFSLPAGAGGAALAPAGTGGRHLRIYYRTYNDYAVTPLKPYSTYFQTGVTALQDRQFVGLTNGFVLFNNSDLEKTVAVDYTYEYNSASGSTGTREVRSEVGELHRVEWPTGQPNTPAQPWIFLARANDPNVDPATVRIQGVRGTSLQTRVVWREGSRWRHFDRATMMTRELAR